VHRACALALRAGRAPPPPWPAAAAADAPSIAGSWIIPLDSPSAKGEKAFRFIVQQHGADVAASILRVDRDTGAYTGSYKDGKRVPSHFDGSRPGVIEVSLTNDGTLQIGQNGGRRKAAAPPAAGVASGEQAAPDASSTNSNQYGAQPGGSRYANGLIAYRAEVAKAKGLPERDDYDTHTTVRDPNERFTLNFPDENGKLVSNSVYPKDHIGRNTGVAMRTKRGIETEINRKQDHSWSDDQLDFNLFGPNDKGGRGSNDFRSMKEYIEYASAQAGEGGPRLRIQSDKSQAVRLEVEAAAPDGNVKLIVNDLWNYANLGLGNYMKEPINVRPGFSGKVHLRVG
jgi:hypothetical protein